MRIHVHAAFRRNDLRVKPLRRPVESAGGRWIVDAMGDESSDFGKLHHKARMENRRIGNLKPLIGTIGHRYAQDLISRRRLCRKFARGASQSPVHRHVHHLKHAASFRENVNRRIPTGRENRFGQFLPHAVQRAIVDGIGPGRRSCGSQENQESKAGNPNIKPCGTRRNGR